jgi:hypothetical protein
MNPKKSAEFNRATISFGPYPRPVSKLVASHTISLDAIAGSHLYFAFITLFDLTKNNNGKIRRHYENYLRCS